MQTISRRALTFAGAAAAAVTLTSSKAFAFQSTPVASTDASALPTVVLVHGAFADSSSWSGVVATLQNAGYPVKAFATPLRGVAFDSEALKGLVDTIEGPVVLAGQSYAGMVISQVAAEAASVVALVYVAAFIPEVGESVNSLNSMYPGSLLIPDNLLTATAPNGATDVYINQNAYGEVYAGGLSDADIQIAAAVQRPIAASALGELATVATPATTPKWVVVATADNAVPTEVQRFMA
ncbi:MAG: alpha/beta fold hydrolase, partial [Thermomicrobiales bacterium]